MSVVRHGDVGRGAGGGAGLKPAGSTTALLRPALEAAVAVAREGERSLPAVPAPGPLRRYLSFARLPDPALEVARRVLDDDEGFRARVAELADEAVVGRAGWLFLTRPDGWEAELEALRKEAAAQQVAAREDRAERDAQRRLAGAEAAAARAEAAAVAAAAEIERLRAELDEARAARAEAADDAERLRAELAAVVEDRTGAVRRLKELEAAATERSAELRALRHELRMAQAELASADASAAGPRPPAATGGGRGGGSPAARTRSSPAEPPSATESAAPAPDDAGGGPAPDPDPLDRGALAAAVTEAATAAERLSSALAAAASLVAPSPSSSSPSPTSSEGGAGGGAGAGTRRTPRAAAGSGRRQRRRPVPLPPGILDDSPTAAEHLVRAPGALVLVDGYNISHAQWHGMAPSEQRTRLLDACSELHARMGADIEVVFDGTGDEPTSGSLVRSDVRYRFTPAGVEADDVLLARVEQEPADRPVIVASSDRRVRDGARQRGANVLGARQLLGLLRR